jgi:hypothetical protein
MSTHDLPYPPDFDRNYHTDWHQHRVERALQQLDPADVLALVDDRISQLVDPKAHPLFPLVNFLLDRQAAVDGAQLYDALRALVLAAIDTCLDEALAREDD